MKISYLHGLESDNTGKKNKWLNTQFDMFDPLIDYTDESSFEKMLNGCKGSKLIIGSSIGGYFAYLIGRELNIPTLLFNPAVVYRQFDPTVPLISGNGVKNTVYLGKNDHVIPGYAIKRYFKNDGVGKFVYNSYNGGHRVPVLTFIKAISKLINIRERRMMSFDSFMDI